MMGQLVAVQVSAVVRTSSPGFRPGHAPAGVLSMCSARCRPLVAVAAVFSAASGATNTLKRDTSGRDAMVVVV